VSLSTALKSRAAAFVVGVIVFLSIFFTLAGPSWGLALYRLLQDGGLAFLWLLAAGGIGWLAAKPFLPTHPIDSLLIVTSIALGLGIISLLVLCLGLLGWMNQIFAVAIICLGDLIALITLYTRNKSWDATAWLQESVSAGALWIATAAVGGIIALAACFPPGLLWGDEPNGYDVVEYHLQVPREWFEAGRIYPLHHNVFSFFPFNVEMHYLLAMFLHGGPWAAMYLAQFMHVGFCALATWAAFAAAGGKTRGIVAGALLFATPWTGLLAPIAYNEGGTLLFITLAIAWSLRAKTWQTFAVAGVFAGLAAGTKLSVAPLVFVGIPLAAILAAASPRILLPIGAYLLAAVLLLSPWLIKDWQWSGNPVFPEAMSVFGRDHFTPVQAQRWENAYLPDPRYRSPSGHHRAFWNEALADPRFGYALFPLTGVALALGIRKPPMIFLAILLLFQSVFWMGFTHLQSRFMTPAIPILVLMIAMIDSRPWITFCAFAVVGLSCFSAVFLVQKFGKYLEIDHTKVPLIGRENLEGFRLVDTRTLDDRTLNLVGDAGAFWYQIPMSRLHYKTVFDVDTTDPKKSIEQDWLEGMPKDAVVSRDKDELTRFSKTYYGIPAPK
jgi:hypothetical protein